MAWICNVVLKVFQWDVLKLADENIYTPVLMLTRASFYNYMLLWISIHAYHSQRSDMFFIEIFFVKLQSMFDVSCQSNLWMNQTCIYNNHYHERQWLHTEQIQASTAYSFFSWLTMNVVYVDCYMYIHIFIYLVGTSDNILLRVYTVHILGYITAVDIFLSCSLKKDDDKTGAQKYNSFNVVFHRN